jgi:hypothetical protein
MKRAAGILFALFVALVPLGWPALWGHAQVGDLLFPLAAVAALMAGWRTTLHRLDLFVVAYLIGSIASIPASHAPSTSFFAAGKETYLAGIYLLTAVATSKLGARRVCGWLTQSAVALCLLSLAGAAVFYATGVAWQPIGDPGRLPYLGMVFRVWGLTLGPELIGNLLIVAMPLLMVEVRAGENVARGSALIAIVVLVEAMTFSMSVAGFAVAFTIACWPFVSTRRVVRYVLATGTAAVVIAVNVSAIAAVRNVDVAFGTDATASASQLPYVRAGSPPNVTDIRVSYYPMSYYILKTVAWSAFRAHPVTGVGLEAFPTETQRAYDDGRLYSPYQRVAPHSTFFGRLAETGLVGTLPLIALLGAILVTARRASRTSTTSDDIAWAVLAGSVGLIVSGMNVDIMNFRFLWFAAGIVRALTLG